MKTNSMTTGERLHSMATWESHAMAELTEILFLLWEGHFSNAGEFLYRLQNSQEDLCAYRRKSPSLIQAQRDGTQEQAIQYYKNPPDEPS
jgi:hypothetical protein